MLKTSNNHNPHPKSAAMPNKDNKDNDNNDANADLQYEVLYYKRSNKVHKGKGQTKIDGILTIKPLPSCLVTLSSLDDNDNKIKVVSSGINRAISKQAYEGGGLHENDKVVLSQFECEIISLLQRPQTTSMLAASSSVRSIAASSRQTGLIGRNKPGVRGLVSRQKKSIIPLRSKIAPIRRPQDPPPTVNNTRVITSQKNPVLKRHPPAQPIRRESADSKKSLVNRIPPAQPHRPSNDTNNASSSSSDDDDDDIIRPPSLQRKKTIIKRPLKTTTRRLVPFQPKKTKITPTTTSTTPSNNNPFTGAIYPLMAPSSIKSALRPHQISGIVFLWNIVTGASPALRHFGEVNYKGAVLADEMGLGKTLMTITVIFALHRRHRDERFIVVCPSSLVSNWGKEFDKWLGKASQPKRVIIRKGGQDALSAIKAFVPVKPQHSEVLIISYELFRMHSKILSTSSNIGLLVVDEGHRLKNSSGSQTLTALNSLRCQSRILITGTPIQNNLSEFHNVVEFVNPGILGDMPTFRRVYEKPILLANAKNATPSERHSGKIQSAALEKITSAFMLRRLQKNVLKTLLPPRMEVLLFCRPSVVQRELYEDLTKGGMVSVGGSGGTDVLSLLTTIRKLCSHPCLVNDTPMPFPDNDSIEDTPPLDTTTIASSGKLHLLHHLLSSILTLHPTDKVVIISNFTSTLTLIEKTLLEPLRLPSLRLDGTTPANERQQLVENFNRTPPSSSFAFLLSSKAGGCGLNLIGANRLIMFDPDWNPANDAQAMARVYRQGQKKPCVIYRLFTTGTVEEVIYQRQIQKGNVASMTEKGGVFSPGRMGWVWAGFTEEELRDCLTLKGVGCVCDTWEKVGKTWNDYGGASQLKERGCHDSPLLTIAEKYPDILSFVHICDEALVTTPVDDDDDEDDDDDTDDCSFRAETGASTSTRGGRSGRGRSVRTQDNSDSEEEDCDMIASSEEDDMDNKLGDDDDDDDDDDEGSAVEKSSSSEEEEFDW